MFLTRPQQFLSFLETEVPTVSQVQMDEESCDAKILLYILLVESDNQRPFTMNTLLIRDQILHKNLNILAQLYNNYEGHKNAVCLFKLAICYF